MESAASWPPGEGADRLLCTAWSEDFRDQVDPEDEPSAADGPARCDADAGFFGAYAATTTEEDFAESFSAGGLP
ncbi:hypothetical protein BH23ACT6_BH23ACT6_06100 [soil metagenome]